MTKVVAGISGLDMSQLDFSYFPENQVTASGSTKVIIDGPSGTQATVKGEGFSYASTGNGFPQTGTIHSIDITAGTNSIVSINQFSLDVVMLRQYLADNNPQGLLATVFAGDDVLFGSSAGHNNLFGLDGNDSIAGGAMGDTLAGGDGVDTLRGGGGTDVLSGGDKQDTFIFSATTESPQKFNADHIVDLQNIDTIDLRPIDANVNKDGNQAFELVKHFSHTAGEMILKYDADHNITYLTLDDDGDAKGDMIIALDGNHRSFDHFLG